MEHQVHLYLPLNLVFWWDVKLWSCVSLLSRWFISICLFLHSCLSGLVCTKKDIKPLHNTIKRIIIHKWNFTIVHLPPKKMRYYWNLKKYIFTYMNVRFIFMYFFTLCTKVWLTTVNVLGLRMPCRLVLRVSPLSGKHWRRSLPRRVRNYRKPVVSRCTMLGSRTSNSGSERCVYFSSCYIYIPWQH